MTERLADAKFKRIKEYYSAMGGLDPDIQEDMRWLINRVEELEQVIGDLDENVAAFETLWLEEKRKNQCYKQALEYIQRAIYRAIYTQHCTKNYKWNSEFEKEFEKGKIIGLIQASNIVDKAIVGG